MRLLKVLTVWVQALKMADTNRGLECKAKVVGHHGFRPNKAIILFIHALHGLFL